MSAALQSDKKVVLVQIRRDDIDKFHGLMQAHKYPYCPKEVSDGFTDARFRRILRFK